MMLIHHEIRIIHTTTDELFRHLTLDPTRNYQPTGNPHTHHETQNPNH